ncbi:MAG: hypothetical protein RRC34_05135 [Lentisphaeria bacterium]|nr:hypothetical protein [Lentisphaeria bacterium]
MNLVPVNALKHPRWLRERLAVEHELLVTNNGRPMAIMVEVGVDEDPETALRAFREARSRLALSRVREAAKKHGSAEMAAEQINDEIAASRAERQQRHG